MALVGFGLWIALFAWRDLHAHGELLHNHGHAHRALAGFTEHDHGHAGHEHHHGDAGKSKNRLALLLILGSSPMIEGIPVFFAASKFGAGLVILMSLVFGASTVATYVLLCVYSVAGLQRVSLGPLERYGEVVSGGFIALVGLVFWIWPVL